MASRATLDRTLERHHSYAAELTANTTENAPRSLQASLRVPAPELGLVLNDLKMLGRVENETQSGEEVTEQHADLLARLKNARATEQRLLAILQQRTGKITDLLQVEQEIARVRGEIEQLEAEQQTLEHRVDFAALNLNLVEEYKAQLNAPAASVLTRLHNALVTGFRNASETVLGIVLFFAEYGLTLLLWLLILVSPAVLLWRRYRRTLATL
jgi:chromosome segregation ATPase